VATTSDYVSTVQQQFLENIRLSQKAVADGVRIWTESMNSFVPGPTGRPSTRDAPDVEQIIDETFDFAGQLVEAQRHFAKQIVGVTSRAAREAEEVASSVTPEARHKTPAGSRPKG
jgi:hypothetical protein